MVTQISINHGHGCLTSVIWSFTLTAFPFGPCLHYANVSHFKDGLTGNFFFTKG